MVIKSKGRVSFHILTRERTAYLACLLWSLRQQTYKNWDLIIVDNNDYPVVTRHPLLATLLRRIQLEKHGVKVLLPTDAEIRKDIGSSRNLCIKEDENEYACRVDDDSIIEPDYLERLMKVFTDRPNEKIGAVGGMVPAYGSILPVKDSSVRTIFNEMHKQEIPEKFEVIFDKDEDYFEVGDDGGFIHVPAKVMPAHHLRSSFVFKNEAIRKIGMHPTEYGDTGFREETELSFKFLDAGYKLYVDTGAICYHLWAPNLGRARSFHEHLMIQLKNEKNFQRKNRELMNKLFVEGKANEVLNAYKK